MIEAQDLSARVAQAAQSIQLDEASGSEGLAQLVLTLVELIHELLERQAIRRMEAGSLDDEQLERIGLALMRQADELDRLCEVFGLEREDLGIDLGGVEYIE